MFGLLPTWSFDWSSAFFPEPDSPVELEVESASVDCVVVAVIASEPTVRSRLSSATVFVSITLTATAAPIATLSPPAAPFEFRVDSRSSVALIEAAPVKVSASPRADVRRSCGR